jgi:photosystem II stability/assembly factor-like uncharacterized protein
MFKPLLNILTFSALFSLAFFGLGSSAISQEVKAWSNLGLYGGQIYDIAIDPSNPDKMFAGTYMGDGLFASTDGGNSWRPVETEGEVPKEDDFKNQANHAVKIAPSDPNVIWVAHSYWVEKSTDGGKTWTHILNSTMQRDCANCGGQGDNFRFCQAIAIDPMNPQIVYVATAGPENTYLNGAIYKTEDGGQTWTKLNGGSDLDFAVEDLDIDPQDSSIIWAVTSSHGFGGGWGGTLYRSGNSGDTWTPILLPLFQSYTFDSGIVTVAVDPKNSNTILTGSGYGIVRFFMDGSDVSNFDQPCYAQGCLNQDITFDPNNPNIVYTVWLSSQSWGGDGIGKVGRSTDGGSTWTAYPLGNGPSDTLNFKTITVHPSDSEVIYAGEFNEGIFKSLDHGQTWTPAGDVSAVIVHDVAVNPNDSTHIIAGTFSGTYEKKGSGNWSQLIRDTTQSVQFHPTNSQTIYAGLEGWLAKTTDGGLNWNYTQVLGPDPGSGPNTYNYVSDIAIDHSNTDTIFISVNGFGHYGQIQKSTDAGASFVNVLDGVNQSAEKYPFNVVAIDPSDHQHIFAGGGSFYAPKVPGDLWESEDGGENWTRTALNNVIVNALLIDPQNPKILYAGCGYSGGMGDQDEAPLYKSTDGGVTWVKSYEGIPGYPTAWNAVTDLEFHRQDSNVVYASTLYRGVYISPNQAGDWLNIGTPEYDVLAISTSSLYAAAQGGLLQCTGTGVIAGKVTDALSQAGIHGATVFNDFGVNTISVNGEYIMVSPCGIWALTAIADGYANKTVWNVTVYGGDVNWTDISMERGLSDKPPIFDDGNGGNGGGSDYECFVATAAYGSGMAEQVQMLRAFRDDYLMPHAFGRKLVNFYYATGKPIAVYIESHPWLKAPVRIILYPVVGLAWLLLSTTAFAKGVIVVCLLIGCVGVIRFR